MAKVLVVEDEESYRLSLGSILPNAGHEVVFASDGNEALARFGDSNPELILLDLMLPGISGTEVCRVIREVSDVPIIMLTAKDSEADELAGLKVGADDYISKLASAAKIVARIEKLLERTLVETQGARRLAGGPVEMDLDKHSVTIAGKAVQLPLKEFELLEFLLENQSRVLTRAQLIDRVWGHDYFGDTKTLDVHIKRLRAKLEEEPAEPKYLTTVRGIGYKFEA